MCSRLGKRRREAQEEHAMQLALHTPPAPITETVVEEATIYAKGHPARNALPPFSYTWAHVMRDVGSWRGYDWVAVYGMANQSDWRRRLAYGVKFPLNTPYKERIRVLDSLVNLCNVRWGDAS